MLRNYLCLPVSLCVRVGARDVSVGARVCGGLRQMSLLVSAQRRGSGSSVCMLEQTMVGLYAKTTGNGHGVWEVNQV